MNYPTNHPFSPRYESQIPQSPLELRIRKAKESIKVLHAKQLAENKAKHMTASIKEHGFRRDA